MIITNYLQQQVLLFQQRFTAKSCAVVAAAMRRSTNSTQILITVYFEE